MSNKDTMRLGFVMMNYARPREITDPIEGLLWHMTKTKELGGGVTQFGMPSFPFKWEQKALEDVKEQMAKTDNELELGAQIFGVSMGMKGGSLIDEHRKEILEILEPQLKAAKYLGVKVLRGSYGRLKAPYSRFNKNYPLKEHIKFMTDNLKEAAKIFEDYDLYFAIENHCDFFAKEFAEIFASVNSGHIGCTYDTGNGFTLFCDPNEDVEYLAPYAFTVHIKDMLVQDFESPWGLIPFQARGCPLGNGNVDIPHAIELLDRRSPFSAGLHLIIEQTWMNYDNVTDRESYHKDCIQKGMKYLQKLLGRV
jgi:sugar phosphate isomerase/epimerase